MPEVACDHCGAALQRSAFKARVQRWFFCNNRCQSAFQSKTAGSRYEAVKNDA